MWNPNYLEPVGIFGEYGYKNSEDETVFREREGKNGHSSVA